MGKEIIEILMRRDHLTRNEAEQLMDECQHAIDDAIAAEASYYEVCDILADYIGLEPDYIMAFI